ncbi:MAG: DNA double-strand break repair nuclease NurA [Halobacteriota archaeon]
MPFESVHFDGVSRLAGEVEAGYDDSRQDEVADDLWSALDPLVDDGERVLYPVESLARYSVDPREVALEDDEFATQHAVDSGTLNPVSFYNGLVVDVAHAAMASLPSDVSLHRRRSVVESVYTSDASVSLGDEHLEFDDGAAIAEVVRVPSQIPSLRSEATHAFALYLAESRHARRCWDRVEDLLYLDGPLYPKGLLRWIAGGEPVVGESDLTREVLSNYAWLVDRAVEDDVALAGFVKNPSSSAVVRCLSGCPWSTDAGFYRFALEPDVEGRLTCSNWFVSEFYADRSWRSPSALSGELDAEDYLPCQMMVREPEDGLVFKVEAPLALVRDPGVRESLRRQLLKEVASNGVPRAVSRADSLARVERGQRQALVRGLEEAFGCPREPGYDGERWGYDRSSMGLTL